jgi:ribosomal protein S18 acetylase RimI-like enzyme
MVMLNNLQPIDEPIIKTAAVTCAEAFKNDPLTTYLIPDERRRAKLNLGFEYIIRMSIAGKSELYTTSNHCEGLAIWHDSRVGEPFAAAFAGNPLIVFRFGLRFIFRTIRVSRFSYDIKRRFAPEPHMYLAWLAVHPDFQGRGYANTLLKSMFQKLDHEGIPCYLETQNFKNVSLYKHYGFRTVYSGEVPGTGIPFFAMLRDAATVPVMAFDRQLSSSMA